MKKLKHTHCEYGSYLPGWKTNLTVWELDSCPENVLGNMIKNIELLGNIMKIKLEMDT